MADQAKDALQKPLLGEGHGNGAASILVEGDGDGAASILVEGGIEVEGVSLTGPKPAPAPMDYPAVEASADSPEAWDNVIPEWAMNKEIRDMALEMRRMGDKRPLPTQCCVGPATKLARYASYITWSLFIVIPLPVYLISSCGKDGEHLAGGNSVSAHYNTAAVWITVAPFLFMLLAIEWKCLTYYIIPVIQVEGSFKVLSVATNFFFWAPFSFGVSLASHMDLVTNGIFLATSMRSMNHCSARCSLSCIWLQTMMDSVFRFIPKYKEWIHPQFAHVVLLLWVMMLIQALYGLMGSTPLADVYRMMKMIGLESLYLRAAGRRGWNARGVSAEIRLDTTFREYCTRAQMQEQCQGKYSLEEIEEYWNTCERVPLPLYDVSTLDETVTFLNGGEGLKTLYQTVFDESVQSKSGHGAALLVLADSTRMVSITTSRVDYARTKVSVFLRDKDFGAAFGLMKQVSQACGHKLVITGILQTGLQLNLQVTLLGMTTLMNKANRNNLEAIGFGPGLTGGEVDHRMVFSIVIGLVNVIKNALETYKAIDWIGNTLAIPHDDASRANKVYGLAGPPVFREMLTKRFRGLKVAMVAYMLVLLYTLGKLVAVFQCPYSMFNINGCAVAPCRCINAVAALSSPNDPPTCPMNVTNMFDHTTEVTLHGRHEFLHCLSAADHNVTTLEWV